MSKKGFKAEDFVVGEGDPLSAEHADVGRWVEEALRRAGHQWYQALDLGKLESGRKILGTDAGQARRYLLAAVAQLAHWDGHAERVRAQGDTEMERVNAHLLPGWDYVRPRRVLASAVVA